VSVLAEGVTVTPAALTQIVLQAAEGVDGARVRRARARRRLEIELAQGAARVDMELAVRRGSVLPDVARGVQHEVTEALKTMCGVRVESVNVSVEELD
jgi:uncharacterized alkaline shock family protein YloU